MPITLVTGRKIAGRIGALQLDATIVEDHLYVNEITQYPIENGSDITDHIHQPPETVTLEGLVTNTPIPDESELTLEDKEALALDPNNLERLELGKNRSKAAYEELMRIAGYDYPHQLGSVTRAKNTPQQVDIITGLTAYTSMVLTRLSIPRSVNTGEALRFTAEFTRIRTANTELTIIQNTSELNGKAPGVNEQAAPRTETGNQTTKTVPQDSVLYTNTFGLLGRLGL